MANKISPIYKLYNLFKKHDYVTRKEVNKLVWSTRSSALINGLIRKWHKITIFKTSEETQAYRYDGYKAPFYTISRSIENNHPVLQKVIRILYKIFSKKNVITKRRNRK